MLRKTAFFSLIGTVALAIQAQADPLPKAVPMPAGIASNVTGAPAVQPPRTKYIDGAGQPIYRNRLVLERSPYLRQHAHNPVDWHPWGDAALAEAKARGVPVFLSVGYATCHWCHVMEEESFDNAEVAAIMNANFVPIKVDRETLPHIDAQYMMATQLLSQRGGWPNNVFLTPEGKPITSMGYAPPDVFMQALAGLGEDWRQPDGQQAMREQADSIAEFVQLISLRRTQAAEVDDALFDKALAQTLETHDDFEGGFGKAPKFPNETTIQFLLENYERTGNRAPLDAALTTLRHIVAGGIHDQVGGGFHRYAVDAQWRTPHFEKMLYNQALMTRALLKAWELTRDPVLERATRRALDYVIRDMTAPEGGFYAAEDADSRVSQGGEMEEGAFYTWTPDQITAAVGGQNYDRVLYALGLDQAPTVPTGSVAHTDPDTAPDFAALDPLLEQMRVARNARPHPLVDTKVIAGWNGLMIRSLATAAVSLNEPRYLQAAERAAGFVLTRMLDGAGNLARAYANGPLETGSVRDYAWMGLGALALYDATGKPEYLAQAKNLAEQMSQRFSDGSNAQLRMAQDPGPLGGSYDVIEGAVPTGNASGLALYAMLSKRLTDDREAVRFRQYADSLLAALAQSLDESPSTHISAISSAAMHRSGETGALRQLGNGVATAKMSLNGPTMTLALNFGPGWHANANQLLTDELIPTSLSGSGVTSVQYPPARKVKLGFQQEPLLVIDGETQITAQTTGAGTEADLTIQICNDSLCLPPEQVRFRLP